MAFTDEQRTDIRFFLGYPAILYQFNHRLENAIDVAGSQISVQNKVEVLLAKLGVVFGANPGDPSQIDQIFQALGLEEVKDADSTVKYGDSSKQSGSFSNSKLNSISDYGRMLVNALSILLGVGIANNIFGKVGYQGDSWISTNFMSRSSKMHLMG